MSPARAASRAVFAVALVTLAACRGADEDVPRPSQAVARPAPAAAAPGAPGAGRAGDEARAGASDAGAGEDAAALVERLVASPLKGALPLSSRSLSVKVALESGDRAVWKPLRKTNRTARYEVAFYRIAPLVGAERTPAAALRRLPLARLVGLLEVSHPESAQALRDEALAGADGNVGGAIIEWISALGPQRFQGETGWRQLAAWIGPDGPSPGEEPTVVAASRMVVADYVLGNWDRFSGGNLFAEEGGGGLWLVDNNGSFARWSDRQRARMDGQLAACARFSASQLERLKALTAGAVRAALAGEEARGVVDRVLTDEEIALLLERRDAVLRRVQDEVGRRGAQAVVVFP
ncbi:MAG: hypothetical protein M0R80_13990 [Proteobacteria bacterium]|jgi:hypothetical protein|nr:hypothetical protein [Pseudomonadota bacterium]